MSCDKGEGGDLSRGLQTGLVESPYVNWRSGDHRPNGLLLAAKQLRAVNGRMAIAALQPVVTEIFGIARFNHVLEIFPDVRTALGQLSAPALAAYDAAAR